MFTSNFTLDKIAPWSSFPGRPLLSQLSPWNQSLHHDASSALHLARQSKKFLSALCTGHPFLARRSASICAWASLACSSGLVLLILCLVLLIGISLMLRLHSAYIPPPVIVQIHKTVAPTDQNLIQLAHLRRHGHLLLLHFERLAPVIQDPLPSHLSENSLPIFSCSWLCFYSRIDMSDKSSIWTVFRVSWLDKKQWMLSH